MRRFAGFGDDHRARIVRVRPGGGRKARQTASKPARRQPGRSAKTWKERSPAHGGTSWGSSVRRNRTFRGRRRGRTVPTWIADRQEGARGGPPESGPAPRWRGEPPGRSASTRAAGTATPACPRERDSGLRDLADPTGVLRWPGCSCLGRQRGGQQQRGHGRYRREAKPRRRASPRWNLQPTMLPPGVEAPPPGRPERRPPAGIAAQRAANRLLFPALEEPHGSERGLRPASAPSSGPRMGPRSGTGLRGLIGLRPHPETAPALRAANRNSLVRWRALRRVRFVVSFL